MEPELALKVVTLVRLVCWMLLIYLGLGWIVERRSRKPDSQLKGFFRLLCKPITWPVARFLLPPGAPYERVLLTSMLAVGVVWAASIVASGALRPG
ncbi:MAG TPA: hypothetical protein VLS93_02185 [Anaeromyxobacteraceae bacterium]|nr:hypothetical protein [Anaeromyxobacteraceae bacterium]